MSVKVKALSKYFGDQAAVSNLTFEARKGEILGFLGPNGAGKSTTMRMLTTYISPSQGSIEVAGCDARTQSLELRKKLGYLAEHNPLYLDLYVKEFLEFAAGIHKLSNKRTRVQEVIEMTGLALESNKKIGQLSKGYRQRVGLAQALIHNPEVLILDEPTAGLDPNQLVEIRKLIRSIGKEKTVVFSSHIMQEVQALCDRVLILNRGLMVANDTIEELTSKMKGESVVTVEFTKSIATQEFEQLEGLLRIVPLGVCNYQFISPPSVDLRVEIFRKAAQLNIPIVGMKKEQQSMEQIFQTLTQS
jgi:ABC-2 type transport system ATP-binding protein